MALPEEPPTLTPQAARALLRVLLKARSARLGDEGDRPEAEHPARPATGRKGKR
ncbi:MAG TPA: hypothetical protein VIV12_06340 [Streptosporangiaceae bacterium]